MSEYHEIDLKIRDLGLLLEALRTVFGPAAVEAGENLPLYGYEGTVRRRDAVARVDRRHIGPAANDLGVVPVREAPGRTRYDLVYSEYDIRVHARHLARIKQEYARLAALKAARQQGYRAAEERRPDGTVVISLRR